MKDAKAVMTQKRFVIENDICGQIPLKRLPSFACGIVGEVMEHGNPGVDRR
jgi:hypothetical protein